MNQLANLLTQHRLRLMLFVIAASVVALFNATRLQVDDVPRNFIVNNGPDAELFAELRRDFATDDNDIVVVVHAEQRDLFNPDAVAAIRRLVEQFRAAPGIDNVYSLVDTWILSASAPPQRLLPPENAPPAAYDSARLNALNHPLLAGQLISPDARTTLIVARIAEDRTSVSQLAESVDAVRAITNDVRESAGDLTILVTGIPAIRADIFRTIPREQARSMSIGALVCLVIGWLLFRRISALVVVIAGAGTGALWTMGAMGLAGQRVDILNSVLPTLILVVGFTDAVHIVHHIRRSRRSGLPQLASAAAAMREVGPACVLTSITTMVGFGSLAVGSIEIIRRLGVVCGIGVGLALFAVLLVAPLLATTRIGRSLHIPPPESNPNRTAAANELTSGSPIGNLMASSGVAGIRWIIRHNGAVCAAGLLITAGLVAISLKLKPDSRITESTPANSDSARALELCDEAFGGALIATIVVDWSEGHDLTSPKVLNALKAVQARLDQPPLMNHPLSVLDLLAALPGDNDPATRAALLDAVPAHIRGRFVRPDLRRALVTVHLRELGTAAYEPVFDQLQTDFSELEKQYPGMRIRLAGTQLLAVRQLNGMIRDLARSLALAAVVIFAVMALALRSLRLGLLTVIPNALPLAVTAAFIVLSGDHLQLTSVVTFSICLGIAVDDTIHFVMRFQRELALDGNVEEALVRTFAAIATALLTTTCVLVGGFAVTLLSEIPSMRYFALLACIALTAALIGDLILLPALLARFASFTPSEQSRAREEADVDEDAYPANTPSST